MAARPAADLESVWSVIMQDDPAAVPEASGWIASVLTQYADIFPFVGVLVVLMILDVLTGIIAAAVAREIDSTFSFIGALKKAQMLLMVAAGLVFERIYPDIPWGRMVAGLLSISEMISIVENAAKAGLPIPAELKNTLRRLKSSENESSKLVVKVESKDPEGVVSSAAPSNRPPETWKHP